jgi:hypothetical protein
MTASGRDAEQDNMRAILIFTALLAASQAFGQASPAPAAPTMLKPAPAPDADTSQPRQRLVTVFGTEACPKPTSKDEVVVCARLPDSEIYRIPTPLRTANNTKTSPFQANRNLLLGDGSGGAGGSIGSCSVNGAGGAIGCNKRQIDAWAQDRASRAGTNEATPK